MPTIMAVFFVVLGAAALGNAMYWRVAAQRVWGTVVDLKVESRGKNELYTAVYEYTNALGQNIRARSNTSTASRSGKEMGRQSQLLVFADKPEQVRPANSFVAEIVGVVLLVIGTWQLSDFLPEWLTAAFQF
jgi:hypothetical protein